jgi:hypothetical protein
MATVVDKARPVDDTVVCAMNAFTQPTPRAMVRSFGIKMSKAETHVPNLSVSVTPVDNTADAAAPVIDFTGFWLASTPKTARL